MYSIASQTEKALKLQLNNLDWQKTAFNMWFGIQYQTAIAFLNFF